MTEGLVEVLCASVVFAKPVRGRQRRQIFEDQHENDSEAIELDDGCTGKPHPCWHFNVGHQSVVDALAHGMVRSFLRSRCCRGTPREL